ncbi:uracil phosphoribosyltransferase homolog isoform X1 [Hydra vulgaris]
MTPFPLIYSYINMILEDIQKVNEPIKSSEILETNREKKELLNEYICCLHRNDKSNNKCITVSPPSHGKFVIMKINNQIRELQTVLRDKTTSRSDFIFSADRLIRLVIEEGLNQLPFKECSVTTQSGENYIGCEFFKGICGVSIIRSGEAMEKGLRDCCRGIHIGKILMNKDEESFQYKVIYARFPNDIHKRKVLLMYPLLYSGDDIALAVKALLEYGVIEENIYVLTLFATPFGVNALYKQHPNISILTTEMQCELPNHFGEIYFGTN